MIKYEIRLNNTITQFNTLEEATAYNPTAEVFEVEVEDVILQKFPDWTGFKNAMFANFNLLLKCLPCNAYVLLTDMIVSAETGATVYESNFLLAWHLLQSELTVKETPLTIEELAFINTNLALYQFSITL